jgi:hypothetical protein
MPTLAAMTGRAITTVAPTTTATALSSIATGLTPGEHGLVGYRMMLGGEVINVLRWQVEQQDRRRSRPPADVQPYPAFLGRASIPVVSPAELEGSAFTEAHLRGGRPAGWRAAVVDRRRGGRAAPYAGERFVYAYYGGIDKIAHERGFNDRTTTAELQCTPTGSSPTSSSSSRPTPCCWSPPTTVRSRWATGSCDPSDELLSPRGAQSGEGRFRWLHARRGASKDDLVAAAEAEVGSPGLGGHARPDDRRALVRSHHWRRRSRPVSATWRSYRTSR